MVSDLGEKIEIEHTHCEILGKIDRHPYTSLLETMGRPQFHEYVFVVVYILTTSNVGSSHCQQ